MNVDEVMHGDVRTISADGTMAEAAGLLHGARISSVVVLEDGRPTGIVTERDVVRLVAEGGDPLIATVGQRMSTELATVAPGAALQDAVKVMAERGIRHLPVTDGGRLVGIVSIRDLAIRISGDDDGPELWQDLMAAIATEWPH